MNYLLTYNQYIWHNGYRIEERFGSLSIVYFNKGLVPFEQKETVSSENLGNRISELKSFTNRIYRDFSYKKLE